MLSSISTPALLVAAPRYLDQTLILAEVREVEPTSKSSVTSTLSCHPETAVVDGMSAYN